MNKKLFFQALIKFIFGVLIIGFLLFSPAHSFKYWNGWLFMGLLFIPMFIAGIILMIKNPELLKKRLNAKEKEFEVLKVFLYNPTMTITNDSLINKVWGMESEATYNNVEVYISFLRKKLKYLNSAVSI